MRRFHFFRASFPILALGLLAAVGCGSKGSTVSGTVTFNGKPVPEGYINFYPADGKSAPAGGAIKDGRYSVSNVAVGKNRVEVTSNPSGTAPSSMDESIKAKETKRSADTIALTDQGNSQTHEISGSTELNLDIKTSNSSDGKR